MTKRRKRSVLSADCLDGKTRAIGEGTVVLGPHKLRIRSQLGALEVQGDHAVVVDIHNNLVSA